MTAAYPIEIRLLTSDEAALYRDIRLESLRLAPDAFSSTFARENAMPLPWFAERMVKGNVFGAFVADELRGVAGYWPLEGEKEDHKAALWGMYVQPGARRSGLGRRLVLAILAHAATRIEQINLSVVSSNEEALKLYRNAGFVEYGCEMKALKQDRKYLDEVLMVRFLKEPLKVLRNRHV